MKPTKQRNRTTPPTATKGTIDPQLIHQALQLHQAGQLDAAEALYNKLLKAQPKHQDALNLLGFLYYQRGEKDKAVIWIKKAIQLDPNQPLYYNNLGIVVQNQGKHEEAIGYYNKAIAINPNYHAAYSNLGTVLQAQGKLEEALTYHQKALDINPEFFEAISNIGNVLCDQNKQEEAIEHYKKSLEINPNYVNAMHNIAYVLQKMKRLDEAIDYLHQSLAIKPDYLSSLNTLGNVLQDQGKLAEAIASYQKALEFDPYYYEAISNMANVLCDQGKLEESIACHKRALAIKPDLHESYTHMANAFQLQGNLPEAIACYQQALKIKPTDETAMENLGVAYNVHGDLANAITCYRQTLANKPKNPNGYASLINLMRQTCHWEEIPTLYAHMMKLFTNESKMINPFVFLTLPTSALEQKACAEHYLEQKYRTRHKLYASRPQDLHPPRLKIGYLSCDFLNHATAILMVELFNLHDRNRFEILTYSYSDDDGKEMRQRVMAASDQFIDIVHMDHTTAAQRILEDGVHILVELKGFTKGARLEISALHPAPIQVSWLGYPGTMGASYIDYIIADPFIIPHGHEEHFSEKVVRLPDCYQPNDRQRSHPETAAPRESYGLPAKGLIFSNFNQTYKITPEMFDIWMALLRQVPESILWLLESNTLVANNLRREAEARGVQADRLIFAPKLSVTEHLARYNLVDLVLDTYPVASHTTASDALWMGCPIVTYVGETFVSRVAGSLLHCIGAPELVTDSLAEYAALATSLAKNPDQLQAIRAKLQANRLTTPLFDTPKFTKNLEAAYTAIWQRHQAGLPTDHIDIVPETTLLTPMTTTAPEKLTAVTPIKTNQPPPQPAPLPIIKPVEEATQPIIKPAEEATQPIVKLPIETARPIPILPPKAHGPIMLSICIPTYNRQALLAQALDHLQWILSAPFAIEIIVCDDASEDETPQVAQEKGKQFPLFRYIRQKERQGGIKNQLSAYRYAQGKFFVRLADDDRLIPETLLAEIDLMNQQEEIIASHAPWQLWNDLTNTDCGLPYQLESAALFGKIESADLFNFILTHHIFPEIAIYRTTPYQQVLFAAHHVFTPLLLDFRALDYGMIRFQPKPFYTAVIQTPIQSLNPTKQSITQILTHLDHYRGGLEMAAAITMSHIGMTQFDAGNDLVVLSMINEFIGKRIRIAANIAQAQGDFIGTIEFLRRANLWEKNNDEKEKNQQRQQELMTGAIYQSMVELFQSLPDLNQLILCDLSNPEVVQTSFYQIAPELPTTILTAATAIQEAKNHEDRLYLTEQPETQQTLRAQGVLAGRVVLVTELIRIFQVIA